MCLAQAELAGEDDALESMAAELEVDESADLESMAAELGADEGEDLESMAAELGADPRATFAALDRMMREHLEHLADLPLGSFGDGD